MNGPSGIMVVRKFDFGRFPLSSGRISLVVSQSRSVTCEIFPNRLARSPGAVTVALKFVRYVCRKPSFFSTHSPVCEPQNTQKCVLSKRGNLIVFFAKKITIFWIAQILRNCKIRVSSEKKWSAVMSKRALLIVGGENLLSFNKKKCSLRHHRGPIFFR